ncbi:hypothetical protein HDV01_001314 [Terramyces sp. JEL0728]|nr:hypothetical protein HDV01_001314 [Terramyces sp. JEL0728]
MSNPDYFSSDTIYGQFLIPIQTIVFTGTVVFACYSITSTKHEKAYNIKIKLLLLISITSQILYLFNFNTPIDVPGLSFICQLFIYGTFLIIGFCELEFLKTISVITIFSKDIINVLQSVWVIWCVLGGFVPVIVDFISKCDPYSTPRTIQISYQVQQIGSLVFDGSCLITEFTLAFVAISGIHSYIKRKYSNGEELDRYESARRNFAKLKYLTGAIVANNTFSTWLYIMRYVYSDINNRTITTNCAHVFIHLTPSLVAYRFLLSKNCIFPTVGPVVENTEKRIKLANTLFNFGSQNTRISDRKVELATRI